MAQKKSAGDWQCVICDSLVSMYESAIAAFEEGQHILISRIMRIQGMKKQCIGIISCT